jgi:hypothetical protein
MFDFTSRYYNLEQTSLTTIDRRQLVYVRRRFIPQDNGLLPGSVIVTEGDRLDLIAARTLGNSELFWRVCDANRALNPFDLTADIGRRLQIPTPQF